MKGMRRNPFDLGLFHHQQEQDVVTPVSDNCFPLLFEIILINGVWSFFRSTRVYISLLFPGFLDFMRSPIGELSQIAPFSLFCMTKRRKNNVDKINLLGLQEGVVVGKGLEGKAKLGRSTYFNLRIRCEQ